MICASCPLSKDEPCGMYETHAIADKDGWCRCNVPYNKIHKIDMEYGRYCGNMGTDMGISMDCEQKGIDEKIVIERCKHMVGLDDSAPYHRHGKAFYRPYRNYFGATKTGNKYLDVLPRYCITREERAESVWYELTREGLDWLGRKLNITIHDER